jgi:hypothetical protein
VDRNSEKAPQDPPEHPLSSCSVTIWTQRGLC